MKSLENRKESKDSIRIWELVSWLAVTFWRAKQRGIEREIPKEEKERDTVH